MAVMPMQRISIYALKNRRKQIRTDPAARGAVEIEAGEADETVFRQTDTAPARARFEKQHSQPARRARGAGQARAGAQIHALPRSRGAAGALPLRGAGSRRRRKALKAASRIHVLWKKGADNRAENPAARNAQLRMLEPWMSSISRCARSARPRPAVFISSFPTAYTEEALRAKNRRGRARYRRRRGGILSAGAQQTCAFFLCHASRGAKAQAYLRSIGLTYPAGRASSRRRGARRNASARIESAARAEIGEAEAEIRTHAGRRTDFRYTIDYFSMRIEKYDVLGSLWQSAHVFVITGYIPAENAAALEAELTAQFGAFVELEAPGEDEDVP